MSKETDEFFRRGVEYGFKAGYNFAICEMQDRLDVARTQYDAVRDVYHMKDIRFDDYGAMSFEYSERMIKNGKSLFGGENEY